MSEDTRQDAHDGNDATDPSMVDVIDGPVGFAALKEPSDVEAAVDPAPIPTLEDVDDDSAPRQPA